MKNKIAIIVILSISIYNFVYSLTLNERKGIEYFTKKGKGIYRIENYEKWKDLEIGEDASIKDKDLVNLKLLENLELLTINNKNITDEGIKNVIYLKKLQILTINECQLTDKGMEYIGQLENLEELDISQTKVTDEGLKHLRGLKKLKELILSGTAITGEGFRYLKELPNLRVLVVSPNVRVENLKYLEGMQLEFLNIAKNKEIDDSAIPYLLKLKTLEDLIVFDTRISKKGVEVLRKGLPKCSIREVTGGKDG